MTTAPPQVRLRRTWPQRILIGFNLVLTLGLLMGAGGLGYFYWRFGKIPRLELGVDEARGPAFNVLLVGSDSRADISDEDAGSFGRDMVSGQRADTVMVLRVDPEAQRAALLSLPRDTWVTIAETGEKSRINAAFQGGPDRLIKTVRENFDIEIHHYMQVDFNGFRDVVNEIGGVEVYFAGPVRDRFSGLDIPEGGCIKLDGDQALGYVRSRHYQYYEGGRWRSDPTGDHGRISRQQDFIRRVLKEVISGSSPLDVNRMRNLLEVGIENLQIDDQLGFDDMLRLGRRFRNLDPDSIEMLTLPTKGANIGGASVLLVQEAEAEEVLAKFRPGIDPASVSPATTALRILNGSGRGGEATRAASAYQVLGFNVQSAGDAETFGQERTQVLHLPGLRPKAELVASYLVAGAEVIEQDGLPAEVVLLTGSDFAGVASAPVGTVADQALQLDGHAQVISLTVGSRPLGAQEDPATDPQGTDPAIAC